MILPTLDCEKNILLLYECRIGIFPKIVTYIKLNKLSAI